MRRNDVLFLVVLVLIQAIISNQLSLHTGAAIAAHKMRVAKQKACSYLTKIKAAIKAVARYLAVSVCILAAGYVGCALRIFQSIGMGAAEVAVLLTFSTSFFGYLALISKDKDDPAQKQVTRVFKNDLTTFYFADAVLKALSIPTLFADVELAGVVLAQVTGYVLARTIIFGIDTFEKYTAPKP